MTERKTLKIRVPSAEDAPPPLKKRGRGWEISEKRLDTLHERARDLRRHSRSVARAGPISRRRRSSTVRISNAQGSLQRKICLLVLPDCRILDGFSAFLLPSSHIK